MASNRPARAARAAIAALSRSSSERCTLEIMRWRVATLSQKISVPPSARARINPPADSRSIRSTLRPAASATIPVTAMRRSELIGLPKLTATSMSLCGRACPRATDPNTVA